MTMGIHVRGLIAIIAAGLIVTGVSACGSASSTDSGPGGSDQPAASTTVAPEVPSDAEGIITEMVNAGAPIKFTVAFTAETDPNEQLGRPGKYTSKAAFTADSVKQIEASGEEFDISRGGGVEVFEDEQDAQKRGEYLQLVSQSLQGLVGSEYTYRAGGALLRVSGKLTPKQAEALKETFGSVMRMNPELVEAKSDQ